MSSDRDERQQWTRAYALQAISDLNAREALVKAGADRCHHLHFLQMAAEKVCKSHLTAGNGHASVRRTHAYVESVLPAIARYIYGNQELPAWKLKAIRRMASEIELIAPACDAQETRKDNSEYPWQDGQGVIQTPCRYSFPNINDSDKLLVLVIVLIRRAAEAYAP